MTESARAALWWNASTRNRRPLVWRHEALQNRRTQKHQENQFYETTSYWHVPHEHSRAFSADDKDVHRPQADVQQAKAKEPPTLRRDYPGVVRDTSYQREPKGEEGARDGHEQQGHQPRSRLKSCGRDHHPISQVLDLCHHQRTDLASRDDPRRHGKEKRP